MSTFWEENVRAVLGLFRKELGHIEAGTYKLPYDLSPLAPPAPNNGASPLLPFALSPQWNPVRVAATAAAYMRDQAAVAARRAANGGGQEVRADFRAGAERYPAYFLQNFHFQSDGWMSDKSAALYDYQVETLFLGSADAMRRNALPHMAAWLAGRRAAGAPKAALLDAATGTGRFLSFVLDNWADEIDATALDLSPFYLQRARATLRRWAGPGLSFAEANVEAIPFPDASFDAITCVYLFHGAAFGK